ncbi:MAG: response regulator [Candidatus Acidiferrum sp.]
MTKLLIVDDEEAVRRLIRLNLMDLYEIVDTGEPEQALALALEHKPDAILLDLRMPRYSGFELCQTFTSFSATQLIPVFVISGEAGSKTKDFCRDLGVVAYFEKPVDFDALRQSLETFLKNGRKERRSEVRVRLRVALKLSGMDESGDPFTLLTTTENISRSGFLCSCSVALAPDSIVNVHLVSSGGQLVGKARVVRVEWHDTPYPRYGFRFVEKTYQWVLE